MSKNKHGLSRSIPEDVKLKVRQANGFGCVICGLGLYHYDHVEPEYKDAKVHDTAGITLLCGRCHDKKTRGFLSTDTVKAAMRNPKAKEAGFSKEIFDIGNGHPVINLASDKYFNCTHILVFEEKPKLSVLSPEQEGAPFRLTGEFTDTKGKSTLSIIDNEWIASSDIWDIEATAGKLIIKEKDGVEHLILTSKPPNEISVDRIRMKYEDYIIDGYKDVLHVSSPSNEFKYRGGGNVVGNRGFGLKFYKRGVSLG